MIPKEEIESLAHAEDRHKELLGHMLLVIRDLANKFGLEQGYRVVANTGADGGQSVFHLHFHLMGKRKLNWPPG